jgi:hypothetical protein
MKSNQSIFKRVLLLFCIVSFYHGFSQHRIPVIKANSKNVKILDGKNYKPDFWVIFPETKPDIYYLDLPRKSQKLKFSTDIDEIEFDMKFGETKDFIVLLNGKDSCYTRISANYPNLRSYKKTKSGNDTIPFTMKDNRIYLQGKINGSELLNMQLDLGAGACNVNKKSVKKIKINFDKKGNLFNSDGINETRVSSSNTFEIAGLVWNNIEMYETKNMDNYEDAIVGNNFFLDKIYKIDYDKSIIVVYDEIPKIESDFVKQDMILDNGIRPVFEATFKIDDKIYTDWFLFDTGNTSNGIIGSTFLTKNNLYDKFSGIIGIGSKKIVFIPQLTIANSTFSEGVITLEKSNKNGSQYKFGGPIGNKILKRFNVIIDNQQGFIYLKPNFFLSKKIE